MSPDKDKPKLWEWDVQYPAWIWVASIGWSAFSWITWCINNHPMILAFFLGLGAGCSFMNFGNIPEDGVYLVILAIVATAIIEGAILAVLNFSARKRKVRALTIDAIEKHTEIDQVAIDRIETFDIAYKWSLVLGVFISSAIAFGILASFLGYWINTNLCAPGEEATFTFVEFGVAVSFVAYYLVNLGFRVLADESLKRRFVDPAQKAILEAAADQFEKLHILDGNGNLSADTVRKYLNILLRSFGLIR